MVKVHEEAQHLRLASPRKIRQTGASGPQAIPINGTRADLTE